MGFIYGLAVVLFIFGGIIIQCEGAGGEGSSKQIDGVQQLSDTDLETIKKAIDGVKVAENNNVMKKIFQNYIILIRSSAFEGEIRDYDEFGDLYLILSNFQELFKFFHRFGKKVKKIEYWCNSDLSEDRHKEIHEKIIKKCKENLEVLRIYTENDEKFWQTFPENIHFPKVNKFEIKYAETSEKIKKFPLDAIFPALKFLKLSGNVADDNCLANVKNLTELTLDTRYIGENKFENIFRKNNDMKKISLLEPNKAKTMHAIAEHLQSLEMLKVEYPGELFLSGSPNSFVVPSVEHFYIRYNGMDEDFSFYMPKLKRLTVYGGDENDNRIIKFVDRHSQTLETMELFSDEYDTLKTIGKLKNIKEFVTDPKKFNTQHLKNMFNQIDDTFKLETLKFLIKDEYWCYSYKSAMQIIKTPFERKWTTSGKPQIEAGLDYITFTRQTCKK